MRPLAKEKNIELAFNIAPDLERIYVGDPTHIKRVLHNILGNAIKFTDHGHISVRAAVRVGNSRASELFFQVADTGIGMSPDQVSRLFQPFTQADEGISRRFGGTGLGLSISSRLVEILGGEIAISSKEGEGSTFSFTIPVAEGDASALDHKEASANFEEQTARLNILVVDDSEATRYLQETMLGRKGHAVATAENGAVAVKAVRDGAFDVVLMDMQMPVMDGVTATREIRNMPPPKNETPVIALTADIVDENRKKYRESGLTSLIGKPINWRELIDEIHRCIANVPQKPFQPDHVDGNATHEDKDFDEAVIADLEEMLGKDTLTPILEKALSNIREHKERLTATVQAQDLDGARKAAHSLKGLCLQYGAIRAGKLAEQMQHAEDFAVIDCNLDEFMRAVAIAERALSVRTAREVA